MFSPYGGGKMHHTFISYAREDINTAKKIVKALKENNLDIWVDWQDIPNAQDWEKAIFTGIENADAFLFLISIDSVTSKICNEEIEYARKNGKRIIPVVISNAEEEKKYKDATDITNKLIYPHLIKLINALNFIFCRDHLGEFSQSIEQIKTAIRTDYEWLEKHTNLQLKALEWERRNKKGGLLSGAILREAQEQVVLSSQKDPKPTELQRLFVNESQKAETRTRGWILAIAGMIIAALAFLSLYANSQRIDATNSEATAQADRSIAQTAQVNAENQKATAIANENIARAGELAAQSVLARGISFDLSMLLSVEAFQTADTVQSKSALFDNTQSNPHFSKYFFGHQSRVVAIEFSPGGGLLASCDQDGNIILWDVNTGQSLFQVRNSAEAFDSALAFSQNEKILASSIGDKIFLWDTESHSQIGKTLIDTDYFGTRKIVFSHDGQWLATASNDTVFLWDTKNYQVRKLKSESFGEIATIAFSPDGKLLAIAGLSPYMFLLDVAEFRVTGTPMQISNWSDRVNSLEFSPDGSILASGDDSNNIILWDVKTQKPKSLLLTDNTSSFAEGIFYIVEGLSFFADGEGLTAMSSSSDSLIVNRWRIGNSPEIETFMSIQIPLSISGYGTATVAFSPNGNAFATESSNGTGIALWDLQRYGFTRHSILGEVLASNRETLATIYSSKTIEKEIILWDIENLKNMVTELPFGFSVKPYPLPGIQFSEVSERISNLALSPNGKTLASTDESTYITLWDTESKQPISQLKGHTKPINYFVFSPNGNILASSSDDNTIILWDIEKHQAIGLPLIGHDKAVRSLAFSPNGQLLASRSDDETVILWDTATHQLINKLNAPGGLFGEIAFNNKGDILAFTIGSNIILWDIVNSRQTGHPISSLKEEITSLAFINNDKFLVTGHYDSITLWDINTQQPVGQSINTNSSYSAIKNLTLRSDNLTLTATGDRFVILLDINPISWIKIGCERAGRNLTIDEWIQYFPNKEYRKTCEQWDLEPKVILTPTATP